MTRQNPIKIEYCVSRIFKEVRHYQSRTTNLRTNLLSSEINISKDRRFNNSKNVSYWIKVRDKNKWSKVVSGLKSTRRPLIYYGDIPVTLNGTKIPKHLLVFRFEKGGGKLIIYLFKNFYPKSKNDLQVILSKFN